MSYNTHNYRHRNYLIISVVKILFFTAIISY